MENETRFIGKAEQTDVLGVTGGEPLGFISNFSDDRQAATIIFNNLTVALNSTHHQLTAARIVSLSIPLENNTHGVCPINGVSGHVSMNGSAKALLLIRTGGNTALFDPNEGKKKEQAQTYSDSFDFVHSFESTVPVGTDYRISFVLLVELDASDPEVSALLTIDSLDIELDRSCKKD